MVANKNEDSSLVRLSSNEQFLSRLMSAIFSFWFFFVGATIGSFLNVVVYRLPLGKSVVLQPSHCPYCKANIKAWHNVPIFGWIGLNGRCRQCRLPISSRYPVVELICGLIFLLIFFVQLVSGGMNLPFREINEKVGVASTVFEPQWELISTTLFHLFMFCTLLTGSLIHWDRQDIPKRFWLTTGFFAAVLSFSLPQIRVWLWTFPFADVLISNTSMNALVDLVVGATVGTCLGYALGLVVGQKSDSMSILRQANGLPICLGIIGVFLGWQATIFIALISVFVGIIVQLWMLASKSGDSLPWFMLVSTSALIHHCIWRVESTLLTDVEGWRSWLMMLGILAAIFVFGFLIQLQSGLPKRAQSE